MPKCFPVSLPEMFCGIKSGSEKPQDHQKETRWVKRVERIASRKGPWHARLKPLSPQLPGKWD
jgi:hypothetical protein